LIPFLFQIGQKKKTEKQTLEKEINLVSYDVMKKKKIVNQ